MTEAIFRHLPWQKQIWERLQQARMQQRLPHAMLLSGPQGVGKHQFALAFTQSLLCASPDDRGEPCGTCRHCHLLQAGNHPDFQIVAPEEGSKSGEIKVDMIRNLTDGASLTAQSGGYKVVLVKPAERMNNAAANSLLKTLEEPVSNTLLILISNHPSRLLPTIRSRCQQYSLPLPQRDAALSWLKERIEPGDAEILLTLTGGAPLNVLSLDASEAIEKRSEILQAFIAIAQGRLDPVKIVAEWSKNDIRQLLEWLTGWVIDMLRLQVSQQPPLLYNRHEKQALQPIAEQLNSEMLQRFLLEIYAARNLIDSNLNQQLMLEKLLMDWPACLQRAGR